jgi:hypothetical protein
MNSTFFFELGGSFALVSAGKVLVGCPGAPGCTTVGELPSAFCPNAPTVKKQTSAPAAASPLPEAATPNIDRSFGLTLKQNNRINLEN